MIDRPVVFSRHALTEARRREIPVDTIERVLNEPGQMLDGDENRKIYQSIFAVEGVKHLYRVI